MPDPRDDRSEVVRAARVFGRRDLRVVDSTDPEPGRGEVLVAVRAVAICPADMRLYRDFETGGVVPEEPIIPGHEFSGVIEEVGEGVEGVEPRMRVGVEPSWHCGECDLCEMGCHNICRNIVFPSFPPRDGAMAEKIACPAFSVHPVPDEMGWVEAALVEPLGVAIHAVRLAQLEPGDGVAILGAGVIGLCVMQVAQAEGIGDIAVAEPREARRPLAQRLGAGLVAPRADDLCRDMADPTAQPRVVFEASGDPRAVREALELCRPAGVVVVIGIPEPDEVAFESAIARRKELTLIFTRRSRDTLGEAVRLAASGKVQLAELPVLTFPLAEAPEAMEAAMDPPGDVLRVVILPSA